MTTASRLKKEDLLLVFLYSKGATDSFNEPIAGRTRLVKLIYIFTVDWKNKFNKENISIDDDDLPEFFSWKYGPMSKDVLQDIEFFKKVRFIDSKEVKDALVFEEAEELNSLTEEYSLDDNTELEYVHERFSLTDVGKKYVEERLAPMLSEEQWSLIAELKKRFNKASLREILQYVYSKHPESTDKSVIKSNVMGA